MTLFKLLVLYVQALAIGAFTYVIVEHVIQNVHR